MWPSNFDYQRPAALAEALQMLAEIEGAKILAGGHSLLPAMKLRLADHNTLIDIGRLSELQTITSNGNVRIGSMATHAAIAKSAQIQALFPALAAATGSVGDQQVRNWGTLGGNIAHADPASDPTTAIVAGGGTIHVQSSSGSRSIAAEDFFVDLFTVDLQPDELITAIELPAAGNQQSAYVKMAHPASRYAVVGVCVVLTMAGSTCQGARIAVGGATVKPVRASSAEAVLTGSSLNQDALAAAADALQSDIADYLIGDLSFPEEYRQEVAGVYLKRAVHAALK
jgi:carbon-monoxide dehydrogenase medium subunit